MRFILFGNLLLLLDNALPIPSVSISRLPSRRPHLRSSSDIFLPESMQQPPIYILPPFFPMLMFLNFTQFFMHSPLPTVSDSIWLTRLCVIKSLYICVTLFPITLLQELFAHTQQSKASKHVPSEGSMGEHRHGRHINFGPRLTYVLA